MFGGFSAKKIKPQLKMASSRFQIASNKKTAVAKQQMRAVAVMLSEDPPKEELAKIRAEALIREDNAIQAYEIMQLECELLAERIKLLENSKTCPPDLVSCVSTLIWACDYVDITELPLIRKQFRWKYGKDFEEAALNNVGGCLNERVVSKLSVQPPAAALVQTYLERICDLYQVDWKPTVVQQEEAQPMAAPVGYSVQVAGGTGLLGPVVVGQESEINYQPPPPKGDIPVAPTDVDVFVPPPSATGSEKQPPTNSDNNNDDDDFGDVDIFVPTIPTAPVEKENEKNDKDNSKSNGDGGGTEVSSSFAELEARFAKLNK